jgi:hypothetical protein
VSVQPERPTGGRKIVPPEDAPARLAELGLSVEALHESIRRGDSARRRVSGGRYPRTYQGVAMWAETLAELRRQLIKLRQGWKIGLSGNYETVYSAERNIGIAVVAANKYTGIDGTKDPKLTRKRGPKTKQRLDRNRILGQMELGLEFSKDHVTLPPDEACTTWFLLVHPTEEKVMLELSEAESIGDDGLVSDWTERILVGPVEASGAVAPISVDDTDDDDDEDKLVTRQ